MEALKSQNLLACYTTSCENSSGSVNVNLKADIAL